MVAVNPARLGTRQVAVLRAAATVDHLIRFDRGTWVAGSSACTRAAASVQALGLLADGRRMVLNTLGSARSEPGHYVGLSSLGEVVLQAWNRAHPQEVEALARRTARIAALAARPGPITVDDILTLAATDDTSERLNDDAFIALSQAAEGREID